MDVRDYDDHRLVHTHSPPEVHGALGQSEAFLAFQEAISRVAPVERPVLIIGERGTGKELAAARLHYLSPRWGEPLVPLNCAALASSLIEAELFGHEAGSFTGASRRREGRFEAADGGTLFLDEIGNIPVETQEKILRVVEYGSFERVGNTEPVQVDVRIIGATNTHLPALAEEGRFMRDLLDRLSFEVLFVPPLRERKEDILILANHFAARMAQELGRRDIPELSDGAEEALEAYAWPGNVRELKNVVERAVYRAEGGLIEEIVFDPFAPADGMALARPPGAESPSRAPAATEAGPAPDPAWPGAPGLPFEEAVRQCEVGLIRRALEECRYNQRRTAEQLGLTYHKLRGLVRKYRADLGDILGEEGGDNEDD